MNYIVHHGIKGQRWGVRRFQNEDGSLTSAGRRRNHTNFGNSKAVKAWAGKSTGKQILTRTIITDRALAIGSMGCTMALRAMGAHPAIGLSVALLATGASIVNSAFGLTAGIQRSRGKI